MIHPATEIGKISDLIGCGVFATSFIPTGTAVYVQDELDLVFQANDPRLYHGPLKPHIMKYSFTGPRGERVLSWDHAKYVNHSCEPNTRSTGYGIEIAVKDIEPGDEITDEYGMFMFEPGEELICLCGAASCRGRLRADDLECNAERWDDEVREALLRFQVVAQPLVHLMSPRDRDGLFGYLSGVKPYRSVLSLKPGPHRPHFEPVCA